jgi:hypothetical protein
MQNVVKYFIISQKKPRAICATNDNTPHSSSESFSQITRQQRRIRNIVKLPFSMEFSVKFSE